MRHNQPGTEVLNLQDLHLPHSHYMAMKREWSHNHRRNITLLSRHLPNLLAKIIPLYYSELQVIPATHWQCNMKRWILRVTDHGVYRRWDDMPPKSGGMLANELF